MKRILWTYMLLFLSIAVQAQTQQGYVKTKGRMVNGQHVRGQGLTGAVVELYGRTAVGVQNSDGLFSFPVVGKSFTVQSVTKKGYQLVDADAAPKAYAYSGNPLYLVMEMPEQQQADQVAAERKLRRTLQQQLQKREDEIDAMNATIEEKNRLLAELYESQQNNEKLIADMAKEYAQMDYDQMDSLNQRISDAILNGRFMEADSLLRSKGDMRDRIAVIRREQQAETQREEEIANEQRELAATKAGTRKKLEDAASDCYKFFDRFKLENQHDSAAYYIALRAEIDTINVIWQKDAAYYLYNYTNGNRISLPDWRVAPKEYLDKSETPNNPALMYAQRALRLAEQQGLGNEVLAAELHMLIGDIYQSFNGSRYSSNAIRHYSQGATIVFHKYGENHPYVAEYYYHSISKSAPYRAGFLLLQYNYQSNKSTLEKLQIDGKPVNPYRCIDIWENALDNPVEGVDSVNILSRLGDAYFFLREDIDKAHGCIYQKWWREIS